MKNLFLNIIIHYYIKSLKIRIAITIVAALLYILLFLPVFPLFGPSTGALATIPVAVAAGLLGFHIGIIASIAAFPVTTVLMNCAGIPGWDAIFNYGGGPPMFILILIGGIVGLMHDLAARIREELIERKEAETALIKSEEKNRAILDVLPDTLFRISRNGDIADYRKSKYNLPGIDADGINGKNLDDLLPEDIARRFRYFINQALETGNAQLFSYQLDAAAGNGIAGAGGTGAGGTGAEGIGAGSAGTKNFDARILVSGQDEVLFIVRDITEQFRAEETKKKDILLKEIHHRIKNNLQIISSLLSLQARYLRNDEDVNAFRESQDRIKTMSLIHERLYQSRDLTRIDFSDYLHALAIDLFYSHGVNPEIVNLEISVEKGLFFEIDTAIPCGLIVNELLTNAFKYAFPGRREGRITISLFSAGPQQNDTVHHDQAIQTGTDDNEKKFTLIISDDGVGLPAECGIETSQSLGLKLVRTLVEQIRGTVVIDRTGGTKFTIVFSLPAGE